MGVGAFPCFRLRPKVLAELLCHVDTVGPRAADAGPILMDQVTGTQASAPGGGQVLGEAPAWCPQKHFSRGLF